LFFFFVLAPLSAELSNADATIVASLSFVSLAFLFGEALGATAGACLMVGAGTDVAAGVAGDGFFSTAGCLLFFGD